MSNFGFPAYVEIHAFPQKVKPHLCNCSSWKFKCIKGCFNVIPGL